MVNRVNRKTTKSSGWGFKRPSAEAIKRRAEQPVRRFDSVTKQGFDTFRPKVGDNTIRFLPPTWELEDEAAGHYGYEIWVHTRVGANNSTYLCLAKMKNKRCPICDAAAEANEAGEEDEAKALRVSPKFAGWILDRDAEDSNPLIWVWSSTQDQEISAVCYNKKTGAALVMDDPDAGYDLSFKRKGQGLNTRYFGWMVDRESSPILESSKKQNDLRDFVKENTIPSLLVYYTADYLEKIISGSAEEKDDELDDEDEKPKKKKGRKTDDDDEAEDETEDEADDDERKNGSRSRKTDDDEVDDDDEDERPSKKKKKPIKSRDEEDDESDENETEEEEQEETEEESNEEDDDEKPAKKKKKKTEDDEENDEPEDDESDESETEEEEEDEKPAKTKRKVRR